MIRVLGQCFICLLISVVVSPLFGQTHFEEVTHQLSPSYFKSGDNFGTGISAADYDDDGDVDFFIGGEKEYGVRLFINQGSSFEERILPVSFDVRAALWIDYNGDGLLDLFALGHCPPETNEPTCNLSQQWILWRHNPNGILEDVTNSTLNAYGITIFKGATVGGLAAGDLNLDGYLDLIITFWKGKVYALYNSGGTSFEYPEVLFDPRGSHYQPIIFDLDQDGLQEIYVARDIEEPNLLYDHAGDLNFIDIASQAGLDHRCDDMGLALGDYDSDADLDLYVTCIDHNKLFENRSGDNLQFGFSEPQVTELSTGWGWGTTFLDVNNDGHLDLAGTNGHYLRQVFDQSNLWLNEGNGRFVDVSVAVQFNDTLMAAGLITADIDRDGDQDLLQTIKSYHHSDRSPLRVLENKLEDYEKGNYLIVRPRMTGPNHRAVGSLVRIHTEHGIQIRPITAGTSFYGQEPAEAFFGLGSTNQIDLVEVIWPGGGISSFESVSANQVLTISDDSALHPPAALAAKSEGQTSVRLSWVNRSEVDVAYIMERSNTPNFEEISVINLPSVPHEYLDTDLSPLARYFYRIRSVSADTFSIPSIITKVTTDPVYISTPVNLTGKVNAELAVELNWEDKSDNESKFLIQRAISSEFTDHISFEISANTTSFLDQSVEPGGKYHYRIQALRPDGFSEFSEKLEIDITYILGVTKGISDLVIYPNPVSHSYFQVISSEPIVKIILLSMDGQVLLDQAFESYKDRFEFNLSEGIYLIKVETSGKTEYRRITVVKN